MSAAGLTKAQARLLLALGLAGGWTRTLDLLGTTGLSAGRAYVALHRLERAGLIESRWDDGTVGEHVKGTAPRRRVYRLVPRG